MSTGHVFGCIAMWGEGSGVELGGKIEEGRRIEREREGSQSISSLVADASLLSLSSFSPSQTVDRGPDPRRLDESKEVNLTIKTSRSRRRVKGGTFVVGSRRCRV